MNEYTVLWLDMELCRTIDIIPIYTVCGGGTHTSISSLKSQTI